MIFKLLFKAMLPIVAMVGIISYGMYMKGGDPAGMFRLVLGNTIQTAKSSVQNAGDALPTVGSSTSSNHKTTVYQWVDEYGVTQFGSRPPPGVAAAEKTFNNNSNVMDSVKPLPAPTTTASSSSDIDENNLPGIAGA